LPIPSPTVDAISNVYKDLAICLGYSIGPFLTFFLGIAREDIAICGENVMPLREQTIENTFDGKA